MASWLWFTRAHCAVYRGTRGLIGGNLLGIPMLLLTTRGRKTGQTRTLPLAYVEHDDHFVIVASNGGSESPPAWWLNLQARPTARVQVGAECFEVTWQVSPPERRMELWRRLQATIPAYRAYRVRTQREIPIVLLKRLRAGRAEAATASRLADTRDREPSRHAGHVSDHDSDHDSSYESREEERPSRVATR
jgi:deazaflavin-dependent oxidoreductase (nitroreductase family)